MALYGKQHKRCHAESKCDRTDKHSFTSTQLLPEIVSPFGQVPLQTR
jgi:hypothetical protein